MRKLAPPCVKSGTELRKPTMEIAYTGLPTHDKDGGEYEYMICETEMQFRDFRTGAVTTVTVPPVLVYLLATNAMAE